MKGNFMDNYLNKSKKTQPSATQQIRSTPISHPSPVSTATITRGDIARRAYEIYIEKGCQQDQNEENWLQAERELRKRGRAVFSS
jgi:hypothetical protein